MHYHKLEVSALIPSHECEVNSTISRLCLNPKLMESWIGDQFKFIQIEDRVVDILFKESE